VADFYISDSSLGLRALVKTGYGARVTPMLMTLLLLMLTQKTKTCLLILSDGWERGTFQGDDRVMRLKEG
jgi:hypothetical protein